MMCQLQQVNMWVLRGILSHGGEKCPGLFLYIKVEDYSDWIMSKTKKTSRPLSSFHHWEESFPFSSYSSHIIVTPRKHSGLGQGEWSQAYVQEQEKITLHTWPYSSRESPDLGEKGLTELGKSSVAAVQPIYYDYHGGEARDGGRPISGQKRLRQPQEITLFFFVLLFFCNGI